MRIGIITCHTPQNYGAMLQAYGLQKYLLSINIHSEIIDYAPAIFFEELSLFYIGNKDIKKNLTKRIVYILLKLPSRIKRRRNFKKFKKNYLNISNKRYNSYEELKSNPPVYDQYICGSDQIWNTKGIRGWDPTFYLQFVPQLKKRNSYAASMSLSSPVSDKVKSIVIPMISEINRISMREINVINEIQPYLKKNIDYVLDPVYLLPKFTWKDFALTAPRESKDYILIYPMGDPQHVLQNARILSKHTGLPIYCITASIQKLKDVKKTFDCSVPKFVRLFLDAKYIVTNSFHGTSFSIIFNKDFWSCEIDNNNHRITSILSQLKLQKRYLAKGCFIDTCDLNTNYSDTEIRLNELIKKSKSFIESIINE